MNEEDLLVNKKDLEKYKVYLYLLEITDKQVFSLKSKTVLAVSY